MKILRCIDEVQTSKNDHSFHCGSVVRTRANMFKIKLRIFEFISCGNNIELKKNTIDKNGNFVAFYLMTLIFTNYSVTSL